MKEIKIGEWIYKSKKVSLTLRIPEEVKIPEGYYLIKVYKLESEDKK